MEWLFLISIGLLIFFAGPVLAIMALSKTASLEREIKQLRRMMDGVARGDVPPAATPKAAQAVAVAPVTKQAPPEPVKPIKAAKAPAQTPISASALVKPVPSKAMPDKATPPKPQPPKPKPTKPQAPKRSLEDRIGAQWTVWVGGLALLIGAVFLIRYSIEAGYFGPLARLVMAAIFGAALLAAGEWLKRADDAGQGVIDAGNIPIPALLSAVGIFTWLGTVYAAYALYGFIPALVAFIGLGVISVGAMALSLRQGPILAAIGLLVSMVTPLLVQTNTPSLIGLYGYLIIVGGAALILARKTRWHWLDIGVVVGWLAWSAYTNLAGLNGSDRVIWALFLALGFGVTSWLAGKVDNDYEPTTQWQDVQLSPISAVLWGGVAAVLVGLASAKTYSLTVAETARDVPDFAVWLVPGAIVALLAGAWRDPRQSVHLLTAGALGTAMTLQQPETTLTAIIFGVAVTVTILALLRQARLKRPMPRLLPRTTWGMAAMFFATLSVIAGIAGFNFAANDRVTGLTLLGVTALFGIAAWDADRLKVGERLALIYVCGAMTIYILATAYLFDGLDKHLAWTAGLGVMAALAVLRSFPGARTAMLALAGIVLLNGFVGEFTGTSSRPVLNALWLYLAAPAALLGWAGWSLEKRGRDDSLTGWIQAAALIFAALFVVFQIRHLSNEGALFSSTIGFGELGLQVSMGLCFTGVGLWRGTALSRTKPITGLAYGISFISLGIFALGNLFALNPLFNSGEDMVGNVVFNTVLLGFGVPTILLTICAAFAYGKRPIEYVRLLGALALTGWLMWMTAAIRFWFNGEDIDIWNIPFSNAELYAISAVWLAFGIGLLVAGIKLARRDLRLASALVILATVFKTFFVDMSGLEGVWRAVSFVGLGLVLIVIGRTYQRLLQSAGDEKSEIAEVGE